MSEGRAKARPSRMVDLGRFPWISRASQPNQIKALSMAELPLLAEDVRKLLIETVYQTGGHLGSNLGVVELTLAMHYVFDPLNDSFIWDVSNQTYVHKILTGRAARMDTIRQYGGLSGFGNREESSCDPFTFGHAGTALNVGHGIAEGNARLGRKRETVVVVGDGALTEGSAYEALNNLGAMKRRCIVVFNDNSWSISKTVGALSAYFNELRSKPGYDHVKVRIHDLLQRMPWGKNLDHAFDTFRTGVLESIVPNIFALLNFQYFGPVDGHDIPLLVRMFQNLRSYDRPIVLHVITKKGRGGPNVDTSPDALHGISPKSKETKLEPAATAVQAPTKVSYTKAFAKSLIKIAEGDSKVVALTAAMPDGTGLVEFSRKFPERFFDVGICEQHAVGAAAGMAHAGLKPYCTIYSTFLQRAYDMVFQEACIQNLPVMFCMDRGGIAGNDGPTHNGLFDIAYLRTLPNITLMAPRDAEEMEKMLRFMATLKGPSAIRYPRANVPDFSVFSFPERPVELGRGELLFDGKDGALLAYGVMVEQAIKARQILLREGLDVAVANARFAKPIDADLAASLVRKHPWVLTLEDHAAMGGFGSAVLEALSLRGEDAGKVKIHAVPDRWIQHGDRDLLMKLLSLDAEGIADVVRMLAAGRPKSPLDTSRDRDLFYGR